METVTYVGIYYVDIDEQAQDTFFRSVKQLSEKESITEQQKVESKVC